ncbi:MAG: beta-galactosidase [Lachnospiraceae bacterium]|nr:beta-galactosidase [Lachnospiraceae bacterium]
MKKLLYGAAYYDEYMPYDRVEKDMEMMEKAGMNVIRIAESTWSTWEKEEGKFDFTSLHRMLDAAKRHHISVIVGTPTYAIPSWLCDKADDMLALTHGGPGIYGHRQNMDITNPIYLKYAERMIRKLMEEVKDEPHVIGFQLDNETKAYDTCGPRAQAMFVERLKEKYPDIEAFNHEFGLDYWSNRVDDWAHFPDIRGTINGSLAAEYAAFQRDLVTEFLGWQEAIVKEYAREDQFITQNFDYDWDERTGGLGLQPEVDQFAAAKHVSIAGCDIYHPNAQDLTGAEITTLGNISRGLKKDNYLVLETEAQGNLGWLPYPGQLRLCAYSHVANGANMVEYWHWHSIHNAIESYWKGVLSHDLQENETYRECAIVGNEWKRIGAKLVNLKKKNKVAVVADARSNTGLIQFPMETRDGHGYNRVLRWICDSLHRLNVEFDVIPAREEELGRYQVVILPALYSATESFLNAINDYVSKGGNLIATFKSGFADEHLKIYADVQPHIIHRALGISYDQFTFPKEVGVTYKGKRGEASEWMEMVSTEGAHVLSAYDHSVWKKYAAATVHTYGKGHAMYLASYFSTAVLEEMLCDFLRAIEWNEPEKIQVVANYPVVVKQGINDEGNHIVYLLNYSNQEQYVKLPDYEGIELLTEAKVQPGDDICVKPWDLCVLCYEEA